VLNDHRVACPFCIQMVEAGSAAVQPDEARRMKAVAIAELLDVSVVDRPRIRREAADTSDDDCDDERSMWRCLLP
jgi:hypothetical protein